MISYKASEISQLIKGVHIVSAPDLAIDHLIIDSRKVHQFKNCMFIALVGDFRDGHQFISAMYQKGVRNFLVSKPIEPLKNANIFVVQNTLTGLQELAKFKREQTKIPVIGITGSNGKTIVKEWLYQLLRKDLNIVRSPKSFNSQIGVALSVWRIEPTHELGVFEAGISLKNEMQNLQNIIQPSIGIFTNIGQAHQENFKNITEKLVEKMKLFKFVDYLIFNSDKEVVVSVVNDVLPRKKQVRWGNGLDCDVQIVKVSQLGLNTVISAVYNSVSCSLTVPFLDDASIENAINCWVYLLKSGYSMSSIQSKFYKLEPIAMRLEQKSGIDGSIIINDAYNADVTAFEIALSYLDKLNRTGKTVILSDILQSGEDMRSLYKNINLSLKRHNVHQFIGVGNDIFECQDLFEIRNKYFFKNTQNLLDQIHSLNFTKEAILIKGARKFKFEHITNKLGQKTHQTQLEINLDALKHNLNFYRKKLHKGVGVMVMVKAYGYGAGGPEVARLLAAQDVNYLGVAYVDEGVDIRRAGVSTPIVVMNPSVESFSVMINYDLEPEIYSVEVFNAYIKELDNEGVLSSNYKIHLKIDTGMNRLGFKPDEIDSFLVKLIKEKHIKVASVFSHLAASDDDSFKDFTNSQLELFQKVSNKIESKLGYSFIKHISNTAAIERYPNAQLNMVRLGIGLYGVASKPQNQSQLQTVSSLISIVVQVKMVNKGESVGYSRNFIAKSNMKIAIIPIGYADGLNRRLGNQVGSVFISGNNCSIVGNICMDLIMVDITGLSIKVNEKVELFGGNISVLEIAKKADTICYEILSSIHPRVKRIFIKEDS